MAAMLKRSVDPLVAFSLSGRSGLYDRARPRFPLAALDTIFTQAGAAAPLEIVELGSGTGIFSRAMIDRLVDTSVSITCVEPAEGTFYTRLSAH